jgi:hypothetical protein
VADYANGIVAVDLATSNVAIVARPTFTAVNGIDGLTIRGNCLFGVQNGVNPNRILAMRLDHGHSGIAAVMVLARDTARITSPTHVITIGTDVLFVENSGFPNYDVKGRLLPGRIDVAPRVGRVSLASSNQC